MLLGKVVGTVVSTRKEPTLDGSTFLVMRRLGARSMATTLGRSQRARFGELRR